MIVELADRLKDVKPYYFVKKLDEIRQMVKEGKDVISFGIGSPDLPPDTSVVSKLNNVAQQSNVHGYQPYAGVPELREGIAHFYAKTYNVTLNATTEILPLMGSKEGVLHTTLSFVNPGDSVLVPNPGYPTYTSLSKLLGAKVKFYNLKEEKDWYPDFEELEQEDFTDVKMLWVNYPHMPTGTPAKKEVFERLVKLAKEKQFLIVHDNPYSLVLNNEKPVSIFSVEGAKDVAIELNSFSKSHNMAGWRVGMVVGREDYIKTILRVKSNIDSGMFLGIQQAAIEALNLDENWHRERNEVYAKRREVVWQILDKLGFSYSKTQEGMFVWAKPKDASLEIEKFIDDLLAQYHIFFTPGFIFGSNGNGFVRLSLCVEEDRMKQALARFN